MLLRDNTAAYGFSLLTAYPDTNTTTAVYDPNLQKQLINALPQTQTYQNGSGTYKTFLEDRLDPASRTCCRYDAANDEIQAYAWSPRYIHRLCITDKNIRYESRPNKPKTTYTTSSAQLENWLKINHPKIIKFAETIQNKIRTYTGYQPNRPLPAAPMPSSPQNQPSPSP